MLYVNWPLKVCSELLPEARGGSFVKLEELAAASSSKCDVRKTPSRPPAPQPFFTSHAASVRVYCPNAPTSTVPGLCADKRAADAAVTEPPSTTMNRRCGCIRL